MRRFFFRLVFVRVTSNLLLLQTVISSPSLGLKNKMQQWTPHKSSSTLTLSQRVHEEIVSWCQVCASTCILLWSWLLTKVLMWMNTARRKLHLYLKLLPIVDDSMGIVNMETMLCNYVACSHGINCICKRTADLVLKEGHDETDTYPVVNQSCIDQSKTGQSHISKFKDILAEVNTWAETTDSALAFFWENYIQAFSVNSHMFTGTKIWPVHPYRKLVKKAKQTLSVHSDNDHSYGEKTQRQCRRSVRP